MFFYDFKLFQKLATKHTTSSVAQYFLECEHAQHTAEQDNHNNRRNEPTFLPDSSNSIKNLIIENYKILYSNKSVNKNQLLQKLYTLSLKNLNLILDWRLPKISHCSINLIFHQQFFADFLITWHISTHAFFSYCIDDVIALVYIDLG